MRSYAAACILALAALPLWRSPGWAQTDSIVCAPFVDPWVVATADPHGGPPPGTIVVHDGIARAVCLYRHRERADDTRYVTFVWVPAGSPPPANDHRLRCDASAFIPPATGPLSPSAHVSEERLAYVEIDPIRASDDARARVWQGAERQARIWLTTVAASRAVPCARRPAR
jgi:hypothetical protein